MEDNQEVVIKSFNVKASEVLDHIFSIKYLLPQEEELCADLRNRKLAPMPVTEPAKADFITCDKDAFLKYLRVSNIKSVMFCYQYYTEKDLDDAFTLSDAERAFFMKHLCPPEEAYEDVEIPVGITEPVKRSDFAYWLKYQKYIRLAVDLSIPKGLQLYAIYEGKILACILDDLWLDRLGLLNAQDIKQECVNTRNYSGYGERGFHFMFDYDFETEDPEDESPETEESDETDSEITE